MFNGAHVVIYSSDANADRDFFRDVLHMPNIDVGSGWLIFSLPPSELAFHPHEDSTTHEFYFMCDNIEDTCAILADHGVECATVEDQGWGLLSSFKLPGGGGVGFYQPRHDRPEPTR